jgi:hypothetical protein
VGGGVELALDDPRGELDRDRADLRAQLLQSRSRSAATSAWARSTICAASASAGR